MFNFEILRRNFMVTHDRPNYRNANVFCFDFSHHQLVFVGGMMSFLVKSKTHDSVKCEVVDGGELKSRRHLNVRGKSATLPSITG